MLLINSSPRDALKIFQPFLPVFVPIGIGYLLNALNLKNIRADFIDEQFEENVFERIIEYTKKSHPPYIFGFSVLTAGVNSAIKLSKEIKERFPDSIIIFGGIHPTALPDEMLSYDQVDIVVKGEGEVILPDLYCLLKDKKDFSHIEGISYKRDGKIYHNGMSKIVKNLDEIGHFPYHLFEKERRYDLGFVVSSRGCPYQCIFCSNQVATKKKYRYHDAKTVADELEIVHKRYGKNYVLFVDDNFMVSKNRVYTLLSEIKRRKLHEKMTFNFQARGDNVDEAILKDMYDTGFRSIFFGIESASDRILNFVKKGETLAEISNAVRLSKKLGYHVSATFIDALPTETHEDRMANARLAKELQIDMARFNNATPYPGTELYSIALGEKRLNVVGNYENFNSISTFIESPFKKIPFSYVPENNTESEIRYDMLFSYLMFYLSRNKIRSIFKSPEKGVGWFNAGEKMLDFIVKIPALLLLFFNLLFKFGELIFVILLQRNTSITRRELFKLLVGINVPH
ncbi:MAG: B12-binding domain-containing radical SAM protein [Oligoflexales bacterium]|nr:B12-binding domain-containing radical SAM protein [Oligoflexales bacterium]